MVKRLAGSASHSESATGLWFDFDIGDAFSGGVLEIVEERRALPLWTHDLLRGNHHYGKRQGHWEDTAFDYVTK